VKADGSAFAIRVTENGQGPVLLIAGDLDLTTAPQLKSHLAALIGEHVALEFSDVTFMDSTAIGVLIDAHKRTSAAGGRLVLHGLRDGQVRLFELMGLADTVSIQDQVA